MGHRHKKKFNFSHLLKDVGHIVREVEQPIINQQNQIARLGDKAITGVSNFSNNLILPIAIVGGLILYSQMKK